MPSKILYIEDSEEYSELAIKVLKRSDPACEVRLTDSLQEVEKLLKAEPFDLVLSDFSLIGFDARDVLKTCAALAPGTPLILLTGVLSDEVAVDLLKAGAADYILKDRVARLPAAVNAAIAEREKELALNAAIRGLAEGEARYRRLFESSSDLIFLVSTDGTILDSNPAFQTATGYRPRKTRPVTAVELVAEAARPDFLRAIKLAAALENTAMIETDFVSPQGKLILAEGSFLPREKDGELAYLQGVFHDITGRRSLEEQVKQARRMDAAGRLAGGIMHDFNNMICAIEGYAALALNSTKEGDPITDNLREIRKAAARAAALAKQLLAFSRGHPDTSARLTGSGPGADLKKI